MIKPKPAGGGWATVEIKISPARAIQRNVYLYMIYIYMYIHIYICVHLQEIVILHIYAQSLEKQLHNLWGIHFCASILD